MSKSVSIFRKEVISWSLYDFANTIYSMNILSLYFKRWVVEDLKRDGLYYDVAYSMSMLLVGLILPALGAISDHSHKKRLFLVVFTVCCCLSLGLIPFIPLEMFAIIIIMFGLSNFFYEGGMVFYNSLLYSISDGLEARLVSGFGVALGYTGSIFGMVMVLPWVTGGIFGIDVPGINGSGKTGAFLPSAVLFLIFSIPLFVWVKEKKEQVRETSIELIKAYREVWAGIRDTRKYPGVLRFLIADYFFEDAIATVILNMGIYSSIVFGFTDTNLTVFLIISTVSAMVGSFLIGRIARKMVLKKLMFLIVGGWVITLGLLIFSENQIIIYILGSVIGVLLGGIWTVSRPLLAEMVPRTELGRFFGLYSLSGRAAAIIGPIIWGVVVYYFGLGSKSGQYLAGVFNLSAEAAVRLPYRLAVFSLILMMAFGLFIFRKIPAGKETMPLP
nr:MFS transporter [candidate division Zixibacteria bacterium]